MKTINRGFTLVELLMTLVVSLILIGAGIPSMGTLIKNNRLTSASNQMITDLSRARSEAIKRGRQITLCPANSGLDACDSNRKWNTGWIAYIDLDKDHALDSGEEVIIKHDALKQIETFATSAFTNHICFTARGVACNAGHINICDSRNDVNDARKVVIAPTGRVQVKRPADICT